MGTVNLPRTQPSAIVSPLEWERRLLAMHGATDSDEFIEAVFTLLRGTVKCDFTVVKLRLHGAFKKLNVRSHTQLVALLR